MEKVRRTLIFCIVILMELLCIYYIYPKNELPKNDPMGRKLSRICLNSNNLFVAYKRAELLHSIVGLNVGILNIMFYADKDSDPAKEYILHFSPLPEGLARFYDLDNQCGSEVFIRNDINFNEYKDTVNELVEDYERADKTFAIGRGGYRP